MKIGITDCFKDDKFDAYVQWLKNIDSSVEIVRLSYRDAKDSPFEGLDGLLLTGGGDVHPRHYQMERVINQAEDVNEQRDEFEFHAIDLALEAEIPIFGICRGMQVMNVYLGGSLVVDLLADGFDEHTSSKNSETKHVVAFQPHSLLKEIAGSPEWEVNSYHHQAVRNLGRGLMAVAMSSDGLVEAAEWALKERMPLLMLVQWHPERNKDDMFSRNLAAMFLREVQHSIRQRATL